MSGIIVIFDLKNKRFLSHMDNISEHINPSNQKLIHIIK